jgi:hypothetical protein
MKPRRRERGQHAHQRGKGEPMATTEHIYLKVVYDYAGHFQGDTDRGQMGAIQSRDWGKGWFELLAATLTAQPKPMRKGWYDREGMQPSKPVPVGVVRAADDSMAFFMAQAKGEYLEEVLIEYVRVDPNGKELQKTRALRLYRCRITSYTKGWTSEYNASVESMVISAEGLEAN